MWKLRMNGPNRRGSVIYYMILYICRIVYINNVYDIYIIIPLKEEVCFLNIFLFHRGDLQDADIVLVLYSFWIWGIPIRKKLKLWMYGQAWNLETDDFSNWLWLIFVDLKMWTQWWSLFFGSVGVPLPSSSILLGPRDTTMNGWTLNWPFNLTARSEMNFEPCTKKCFWWTPTLGCIDQGFRKCARVWIAIDRACVFNAYQRPAKDAGRFDLGWCSFTSVLGMLSFARFAKQTYSARLFQDEDLMSILECLLRIPASALNGKWLFALCCPTDLEDL